MLLETYTGMHIMIIKLYNHTNMYMSSFGYVWFVREKWRQVSERSGKSQGILKSCQSGNPAIDFGNLMIKQDGQDTCKLYVWLMI